MSFCDPCKQLLSDMIEDFLPDENEWRSTWLPSVKNGFDQPPRAERSIERDLDYISKAMHVCWFCCRLYLMVKWPNTIQIPLHFSPNEELRKTQRIIIHFSMYACNQKPKRGTFQVIVRIPVLRCDELRLQIYLENGREKYSSTGWLGRFPRPFGEPSDACSDRNTTLSHRPKECEHGHQNPPAPLCSCRVRLIKGWLHTCIESHGRCSVASSARSDNARRLPKRLVSIGKNIDESHVVEVEALSSDSTFTLDYATLSHCWGRDPLVTLTCNNYHEFLRALPIDTLGTTFSEALKLCQALGIEYLWIDSLCIIQDSEDGKDWKSEAPQMHHIYGGSMLNLNASASKSCSEGLFRTSSLDVIATVGNVRISEKLTLILSFDEQDKLARLYALCCFMESPLRRRSWILQETFLSTRNLHWTEAQIFWQCNDGCQYERCDFDKTDYPGEEEDRTLDTQLWSFRFFHPLRSVSEPGRLDEIWFSVAKHYCQTKVTNLEDVFNALAGLAAAFEEQYTRLSVQTRYLAGCWQHRILTSLDWTLKRAPVGFEERPRSSRNPSWSWLSVLPLGTRVFDDGPVQHPYCNRGSISMEWKGFNTEHEDPDQIYGPVKRASLHVRALTFTVRRIRQSWSESRNINPTDIDSCDAGVYELHTSSMRRTMTSSYMYAHTARLDLDEEAVMTFDELLTCAVISINENRKGREVSMRGLILKSIESKADNTANEYHRIGTFNTRSPTLNEGKQDTGTRIYPSGLFWQELCIL